MRFDETVRTVLEGFQPGRKFLMEDLCGEVARVLGYKVNSGSLQTVFLKLRRDRIIPIIKADGHAGKGRAVYEIGSPTAQEKPPPVPDPPPTKECKKCRETKPVGEFHLSPGTRGGISNTCKKCKNNRNAERRREQREQFKKLRAGQAAPAGDDELLLVGPHALIVDFENHQDLLTRIRSESEAQIRTPEQQAIFFILRGIKAAK